MKKRVILALYLNKMNRIDKVKLGKSVQDGVTGNTFFPAGETTALLADLKTTTDALAAAEAETASRQHDSFAAADTAEIACEISIRAMADYVQNKADLDLINAEEMILSANFKLRKAPVKSVKPLPVKELSAQVTGTGTSIKLFIGSDNPSPSTRYEIIMTLTPDVETSWVEIMEITARKALVEGLANGKRYYFRARAVNNLGKSEYSDVVSQIAA